VKPVKYAAKCVTAGVACPYVIRASMPRIRWSLWTTALDSRMINKIFSRKERLIYMNALVKWCLITAALAYLGIMIAVVFPNNENFGLSLTFFGIGSSMTSWGINYLYLKKPKAATV
jgi:hypothetical protein